MSNDDAPKTAGGMVVAEAIRVVPQEKRDLAGQQLGDALVNATQVARDLTQVLTWAIAIPRGVAAFGAWTVRRWRRMRPENRLLPPTTLLLTAGAGHSKTSDAELRGAFENLVTSAMDKETAPRVHPAFARNLSEMTPLEARIMRLFRTGGAFASTEAFAAAVGMDVDAHAMTIAMSHLERLGFLHNEGPAATVVGSSFSTVSSYTPDAEPGLIYVAEIKRVPMTVGNKPDDLPVTMYGIYRLTALGSDFIDVVQPVGG